MTACNIALLNLNRASSLRTAVLFWGVNPIEGKFVVPQLIGRTTELHPLAVMLVVLPGRLNHGRQPELERMVPEFSIALQPTHRHHPDNQQDPIRFGSPVKSLDQSLRQKYTPREYEPLLEPFPTFAEDNEYWSHTLAGPETRTTDE